MDGKPLYQKTVHIGNLTFDTNWHNVAHGIANIENVISCEGILFGVDGEFFPLPNYHSNTNQGIVWGVQGTSSEYIAYINNWYNSTNDAYATLRYTKTTDTAGSGHLTTTGTPTVHYSTDEKVVGKWIDGKPLYECTISVDNPTKQSASGKYYYDVVYNRNDIEYAQLVSCSVYDTVDGRWLCLPYQRIVSSENIDILAMAKADGSFQCTPHFSTSAWYNLTKIRYTVQYTKTTD